MQAENDETDRPQSCGDTVGIQPKDDRILAPHVRMRESMAALDVVSQTYAVCRSRLPGRGETLVCRSGACLKKA
jgi:hypothetical protein